MNINEFAIKLDSIRKQNKNKWYYLTEELSNGLAIQIKGFNTWLQIFRINGLEQGLPMDMPVKTYRNKVLECLTNADNKGN